jgi:exodeoxyribonuclease-5
MAGCEYYVNGEWISVNAFKEMLNAGLLDNLVASKQMTLPGFKVNQDKVVKEETKEVINDSIPAIKLAEILANEIKTRQGYPSNMLSALELNAEQTEFKIPLWASPHAKKFESLLTSLVSNKVVKQKLFGGSYVLGSEEGVKIKEGDAAAGDLKNSNIVFSSKFDASQGLLPMRIDKETGKVLPAQIMIPFKFRNEAGEILDINEFTTKDAEGRTILDTTKIPDKLLQLFGFRIPTQERNSMAAVEIVGFLPEAMGDLILAPRDFTKQMGSDFDVDKLYTYMYNHFYKDGKLHTNFKSSKKDIEALTDVVKESIKMFKEDMKLSKEDRKLLDNYIENKLGYNENDDETSPELLEKASDIINQALSQENKKRIDDAVNTLSILDRSYKASRQNKLLDIHLQIMTSNNPEVIASVLALDSFGEFEDLAKEINDIRIAQGLVPPITTILSETYQRTKFVNATAGKSGVGTFSLDSTFNATAQGKDLTLMNLSEENRLRLFGTFLEPRTPSAFEILEANEVITAFGDVESKGDMSNKYTLRSQELLKKGNLTDKEKTSLKMKSSIIRALQSTAVDNEKAQILDKLNINNDTFDAIRALAILGFEEEEIVGLITQEIIWEYIELLKNANSSLTSYDSKAKENIVQQLADKYDTDKKYDKLSAKDRERYSNKSAEELRNDIATQKLMLGANNDFNLGQLVLLDKFLKLSEIGIDIKSVQSAINTESKGLPKSLIEVDVKVNQIKNLAYSNIFNATKLLGDVEGEGLNPTTINGYAAVYGTMFADGIFNKYFPYKQPGFKDVVEEVLSHTPTSAVISTSKQVSTQEDVFKDIRSYLYATTNTNLFNSNPDAERARLFIDTKTNQSLASILTTLSSQKWYQKNAFLNKLTSDLNKDGTVSTINFEAATGENLDEKSIYAGFVYLLDKNVPLGTFNGIPYTSRLLAQDLVAAAFLEGGNQGAKQYLKFVPSSYLKTIGFGDYLNDVKFNFEDTFKGFKGENGISYHQPSAFTRQYIQNNPSKAKTVTLSDLQANETTVPEEFTLNKEALKNNIIKINDPLTGDEIESQTHFLSIYDSKLPSNYALYEFDTIDRVYKQIPTLAGKYGFVQYNANNSIVIPVEAPKTKQPIVQQSNPQYTVQNTPTTPTQTFNPNVINNEEVVTMKDLSISKSLSGTKEALQDLFNALLSSNEISPLNRLLLETYQSLQLPKNFKVEYNTEDGRGSYNTRTQVLKISLANKDNNTVDGLATTLAHELSHTFTAESIQLFEEGKLENLTESEINACKNLKRLQNEYVQTLIARGDANNLLGFYKAYWSWKFKDNPIALKQKLEEDILGLKIALNTPNITLKNKQNISKYYGGIKLTEFVAMALTDADFQQHLNEITDSEGVSWWDKIKSFLSSLISKLGFDVKKGSLLGTALRDSLDLIKANQKVLKAEDSVFNTTDNLFTTKIDQFTYSYNPETNEVIHNAKTGNKIETNDTQINKVLVKYALANNYEQRTFNGSTYVAIADRVLNIKNANEVSPETWESAKTLTNKSDAKINIYASTGENAELSNFAFRPFLTTGDLKFNTVEGAFQYAKIHFTEGDAYTVEEADILLNKLQNATGAEAKKIGRTIKNLNTARWDEYSSRGMKKLLLESFEQNPDALAKLLATGDAILTHTQDKTKWGKEFPRLLMEVREEFKATQPSVQNQAIGKTFNLNFSLSDRLTYIRVLFNGLSDNFHNAVKRINNTKSLEEFQQLYNELVKENNWDNLKTDDSSKTLEDFYTDVFNQLSKVLSEAKTATQPTIDRKTYSGKVTKLAPNQIFVFGSNPEGRHGAGAAKYAKDNFGAMYGQGEGLQGQSYALPTKDLRIKENNSLKSISPKQIISSIKKLYNLANSSYKEFLVSDYSGTNLNGYTGQEMADMFIAAGPIPNNIVFHENFDKLITTQPSTSVKPVVNNKYELFPGVFANQGQTEALDKLTEFLNSDKQAFLLQGKGGTGKTTIIKKIIADAQKQGKTILGIAPSHKAKKVLSKSLGKDVNVATLAASLAIKLNDATGEFQPDEFARSKGRIPIKNASLVIIDESSMVSDKLLEEIKKFLGPNAKIIFMGDRAQLPPVGQETDSKVFDVKNGYELTEKMRQAATSPIINIGTIVSNNVESSQRVTNPITDAMREDITDSVSGSSITWESDESKALRQFAEDFKEADGDVNYVKVVTFNNENNSNSQSVKNLNDKIRKILHGEKSNTEQFVDGELLTAYDTFGGQEPLFYNSEDFTVENSELVPNYTMTASASSRAKGERNLKLTFDVVLLTLKNEDGKIIPNIPVIAESSKQAYNALIAELSKKDLQLMYAVKEKYANLQYGYAITSHKAQGSTYTNVYVMEDNIMGKSNGGSVKSKNQSLYVAVSRPTTKLVMVSSKNSKIAPGLSNLNFEALGNAGAFSSSNFNPEDYEGRIRDEGPSEDDWELFNRSNDEMLEESPISEENVENYSLLCGK